MHFTFLYLNFECHYDYNLEPAKRLNSCQNQEKEMSSYILLYVIEAFHHLTYLFVCHRLQTAIGNSFAKQNIFANRKWSFCFVFFCSFDCIYIVFDSVTRLCQSFSNWIFHWLLCTLRNFLLQFVEHYGISKWKNINFLPNSNKTDACYVQ